MNLDEKYLTLRDFFLFTKKEKNKINMYPFKSRRERSNGVAAGRRRRRRDRCFRGKGLIINCGLAAGNKCA